MHRRLFVIGPLVRFFWLSTRPFEQYRLEENGRRDTQHNEMQHNDIQHNNTQHKGNSRYINQK